MRKETVEKLEKQIERICHEYSQKRERNPHAISYEKRHVQVLSEVMAGVTFTRRDGRLAFALFYYLASGEGYWRYIFLSDSHMLGFRRLVDMDPVRDIEAHNYPISKREMDEKTKNVPEVQKHETDQR